jgi:hypothetical protein
MVAPPGCKSAAYAPFVLARLSLWLGRMASTQLKATSEGSARGAKRIVNKAAKKVAKKAVNAAAGHRARGGRPARAGNAHKGGASATKRFTRSAPVRVLLGASALAFAFVFARLKHFV